MKTTVEKFKFIAKIARNVACLSAFFALSASADDVRTLGYATSGAAAALPAAPDMGGTVVNVTAAQAQYVLDGAYGSIDGKTINFTESVADTLVLGRASKYAGSGTLYRHGSHDGEAMSYADFIAYKNQATWTEGCYYERTVENVTFTADKDVIVNFTAEGGAHVYGMESAPVYDYVRDTGTWIRDTNNSFYKRAILKNIMFRGLTFTAKTDFNTSESTTVYDGFTFTGCTFEIGSTDAGNYALRYYNENNNGSVRNLVVENCTFRNCFQGIYTHHVKGITVKDCLFDTTGHNAIAIQSQGGEKGACDHGVVVITGNTFKNIGDRIIRFNEVGAGTTITIADNTADENSGKKDSTDKREIVKASSLPENASEIITASNNDWGANAVVEDVFADAVKTEKALRKAFAEAPTDGTAVTVTLGADITLETLYAAENFGTETLDDNAAGDTFNRYKIGVHPTAEDPSHWNPLVTSQTEAERVVYGAYYHSGAADERIARLVVKAGQKIVLDLNGHTIQKNARATHGDWSNVCTDIIGNYGVLEVVDSSEGAKGTIKGIGYNSCSGAVLHNYEGASMTVGAVNVDGNAAGMADETGQYVISNEGGALVIDGANVFDTATSASLVMSASGTVTIRNATLSHPATKVINAKGGVIDIESASVTSEKYAIFATKDATVNVKGAVTITGAGTLHVEGDAATIAKMPDVELPAPDGFVWVAEGESQILKPVAATIGAVSYETLDAALSAVRDGETIVVNAGEYKLTGSQSAYSGKAFTVKAAEGATVSFDMSAAVTLGGAKITFEGVTFDYKTNDNYIGLKHADTLVYNDCTINGKVFLYATSETFNRCTFNQSAVDYNVWTYGAQKVAFNACAFNCAGKSVLVYNEGTTAKTDLTVASCEFNASAEAAGKAAIEIDTSLMVEGGASVAIDGETTATGFATGSNSGSALWNDKKQTKDTNKNVTVTVAGETVFAPVVAKIGETGYASLADALAAAKDGDVVDLLANATVSDYVLDKGVTIRSAGETRYEIKGLKAIAGSGVTLENVFLNLDQTLDIGGTDTTLKNCAMRAKDVGYWDIVDGKTTGFTGGTAYQGNAYTYLVRVSGTRVSLTDCLIDGTDNKESYFPNMCLAPVTGTDVTMTRCTFNEGYAACYYSTPRGTWTLEDCTFTKIFCYNIQAGDTAAKIVVKGCSLAGWTSFGSSMTEVSFEDCAFAKSSGYATIVAYKNATFSGCTFTEDYKDNLFVESNTAVDLNGCSVVGGDGQPSATVSLAGIVELDDGTAFAALDATKDENGKYTAGTFVGSADAVRAAVAEGRALKTDADGFHSLVEAVAQIGSVGYASLAEAIAAAKDGETVTLLADVNGDGIVVPKDAFPTGLVVDFAGHTYTVGGLLVGSSATKSNGFQLLEGNKITFKNGALVGAAATAGEGTDWTGAPAILIQNYCDLTLEKITVKGGDETCYTLSNNNGDIVIADSTIVAGKGTRQGPFAFDVCRYASYPSVHVTVTGDSVIDGDVEVSGTVGDGQSRQLDIAGGTFNGTFSVAHQPANIAISGGTFSSAVPLEYCAEGFIPTANGDGTFGVKKGAYVAAIGEAKYETVDAAMEAAAASETATTVKLLAESADETVVPTWWVKSDVTIDADDAVTVTFAPIENATDAPDTDGMAYLASDDAETARTITVGEKVTLAFPDTAEKKGAFYVGYGKDKNWAPTHLILNGCIEAYLPYIGAGSSLTVSKTGSLKALSEDLITRRGSTVTVTGTDGAWSAANPQVALGYSSQQGGEVTFKDTFVTSGAYWTMWNRNGNADVATKLTLDNTTFTAGAFNGSAKSAGETSAYQVELKNGSKMTVAGDFAVIAEGAVTIEAGSLLTAKSISNAGTLTVRADALTDAVKVVDYTGADELTLADYGTVKAEGGELYVEDNDLWIRPPAVAAIGAARYASLADALAAAKEGDTVTLLADIVVEGPNGTSYNVTAGVTLDLNGHGVDGTNVGLNYRDPAALGLTVEGEGVLALVNTAATAARISGYVPLLVASSYGDPLKVEIGDGIELAATAGGTGNGVQLDSSVYLAYGDKTAALFKNGGFKAVVGGEARIYTSFDSASDKADDTTAVLLNDYAGDQPIKVMKYGKGNTAFTLDLDGHSYTYTGGNTYGIVNLNCAKTLTVKNGTLADNVPSADRREAGVKLEATGAKVTLENVVVETTGMYGVATSGSNKENDVTLVGTTIRATNGVGVYFPSTGTLTIDGGAITGLTGVQVCAGRLLITGEPTITATGAGQADIPSSGAVLDGAAVSVVIRTGYGAFEGVAISGGQFTSAAGVEALQAYAVDGTEKTAWAEAAEKVSVSGGTFSTAVSPDYCAEGFIPTANDDGTFGVKEGAYVAAIGEVKYETLQAALAAAQDGDTVKMLADAELTAAQTIAQTLVLDLNGKAIRSTVDKFLVIAKGGDLTVNDATNEGRIENTAAATSAGVLKMTGGVLTVNGGTIAANTATSAYSPTIIVDLGSPSTINLAGGRIEAIRTANHAQGVIVLRANAGATLNVTGGEIVGSEKGVFAFAWNTVNISGGTIVGQTGNAVYAAANNTLAVWGGSLEADGTAAALGIGGGNCTVTIGRAGGTAGDVTLSSLDFKASGFSANKATVNLLSGTVKEFRNWTSMTVEKVSQGAATLLVGTDISTKLPGSNLLCQKDAASGLYEVVELTAENAAATVLHDGVETPYNTVDQARRAVAEGDTLTLKVDYEGSLAFTAQNVTVDLGGKTLTGASNSPALSFNQSATADNRVTVRNGTIIAKGQDAACIRATSGDAAKTLTVVLGDGLTLTAGSNNRSGRVVLAKGARTAAPCADVNNGGLRVTEDGTDWIYGETETAFIHANGAEVTLLNDWYSVDYDGTIKVPETAAFASARLNLGGHTVKAYGGAAIVMGDDAKPAEGAATKSLEISNGVILTSSHGAAVCGSNKTLVLDGVQLTTTGDGKLGLYANGMTSGNAVTLKNGSALTAEQGTGLYFPGAGTLTVADSAVTGAKSGIEIRAGVLNVSGTSEIASTAESFSFENDDNGVTTTGAAVAAVKHTVGNDLTVNISGGTFKGPRGFYANDPNPTTGGSVAVAISGGTFSTAVLSEHCAAGYEPVTNADGTYGVRATFTIAAVKVSADSDKTIDIRVPYALLENVAGETQEEKVANLSKADANGNLAWVNLVAGIDSAKKVTMTAPQNNEPAVIDIDLPTVGEAPEGTDVTVRYEIRADGSEAAVVSAEDVEDLVINLNGKAGIGTYRAYVCLLQNGTEVACVESANALGVLQTVCASKKTIIAVPWLSLTDGNAIAVADLVKTAGLTAGDKLHVYNKAENRYDVYELTTDKAWAPKAIYKVGADGTVETASSGTPETTTVARGSGVWIERQDTTQPIVSYGAVASATVATTIDEGTAEKKAWNLLAVPTTTAIDIAATFGASETDEIIVPTDGAPKVCTVKDGAWGYDKTVSVTDQFGNKTGVTVERESVTELPAGTGFWYLNGGAAKTVNW